VGFVTVLGKMINIRHSFDVIRLLTNPRIVLPPLRLAFQRHRKNAGTKTSFASQETTTHGWRQRIGAVLFILRWLQRERLMRHRGQWVINSFIPPFPGSAFDRMFEPKYLNRSYALCSAALSVTDECPADCWHCSIKNRRQGDPLTTTEWLDAIDRLLSLGVYSISFTGGEPTLRDDLPILVQAASRGGAVTQLYTSGIGLTRAKIDALREVGLWAIGVSLDHTDPETVNSLRRSPQAFEAAIAALEASRRAGLYTFINAVADREATNSGEYQRLYDLASRLKLHELRLLEPMPCGRLDSIPEERLLGSEHISRLRRFHHEMNRRGQWPKVCAFNEMESPDLFGCSAGICHLFIDPSGEVCPCDFVPLSFGNIRKESLEIVYDRMSSVLQQPRRNCFIQTNATLIQLNAFGHEYPLQPEMSMKIAAESPVESLPDYYQFVAGTIGFPLKE
jgi:MoaA/NifB/PqqE/SkfB family radical SAM enzyme